MEPTGSVFTVTADVLSPILDTITANAAILVPAGLAVTITVMGVTLIPKLVKKLVKA